MGFAETGGGSGAPCCFSVDYRLLTGKSSTHLISDSDSQTQSHLAGKRSGARENLAKVFFCHFHACPRIELIECQMVGFPRLHLERWSI